MGKNRKIVSGLVMGAGGAVVRFLKKKNALNVRVLIRNPVINRNGADEVETKMRNEGFFLPKLG